EQELKEYRPVLTSTSPGKGYWRQQLDHVAAHLRAYAVNQPDFQALIGKISLLLKWFSIEIIVGF
ncbi:unnamed protein product, partial [Rotaria magnacalcarata]